MRFEPTMGKEFGSRKASSSGFNLDCISVHLLAHFLQIVGVVDIN